MGSLWDLWWGAIIVARILPAYTHLQCDGAAVGAGHAYPFESLDVTRSLPYFLGGVCIASGYILISYCSVFIYFIWFLVNVDYLWFLFSRCTWILMYVNCPIVDASVPVFICRYLICIFYIREDVNKVCRSTVQSITYSNERWQVTGVKVYEFDSLHLCFKNYWSCLINKIK